MPIHRSKKNKEYVVMSNVFLQRNYTRTADGKIVKAVYEIFKEPVSEFPTLEKPQAENLKPVLPSP